MGERGQPRDCVVDTYANRPPVPPRTNRGGPRRAGVAQTMLFLLVSLALCGMVIEAYFILRLYKNTSGTSASSSKLTGGEDATAPTMWPNGDLLPSKPTAHLTDGQDVVHESHIMGWSMIANPLLHEISYRNGSLLIQKEGYYYIYSKVSFIDKGVFYHSVDLKTKRYTGKSIPLLNSREYSEKSKAVRSNSYLGGVFHLREDDAVFVKVSSTSRVLRHNYYENIFGAYMI